MGNAGTGMEDIGAQSPFLLEEVTGARSDSNPFKKETLSKATPPGDTGTAAQVKKRPNRRPLPLAGGVYMSENSRPSLRYGNGGGTMRSHRGRGSRQGRP
jgi:hypothetical protein